MTFQPSLQLSKPGAKICLYNPMINQLFEALVFMQMFVKGL